MTKHHKLSGLKQPKFPASCSGGWMSEIEVWQGRSPMRTGGGVARPCPASGGSRQSQAALDWSLAPCSHGVLCKDTRPAG